ncbi:50S ribosomal protein L3 N(5)-glutamine methyltransferase [Limnobacter humi]|uniref:50S ribosomal protein L3 N(5)-glutamine methyltransferase n=1 Tax=Limnobacter humi TaxID=1778671 RepID=A0ABT1WGM9_9BURK|nr:50S ribosomal protein L3 N(5)-glutamine methyltransferase [Limnobacter humi]MCQ8896048.1 50S ribosomal protein L3 N(5)-glutamine methyltransferase [Limnobacter humi]
MNDTAGHIAVDIRELKTVRDWIRFGVSEMRRAKVFFGHGCTNAFDEAVYLTQTALSLPVMEPLDVFWDARLTEHEKTRLLNMLTERIVHRKPASYITGESWLQGHRFDVDKRVIIPRSFIAELLADQLTPWVNDPDAPLHVLDMCTGSACLAILAAHAFNNATVVGADLSADALEVAQSNVKHHQLQDRLELVQTDLFEGLPGRQFDLIITNPPYVNEQSMRSLPPEYLHEPRMALAGGDNGMQLIDRILLDAPKHLSDGGLLVVELGNERPHFENAYPDLNVIWLETSAGDEQVFLIHKEDLE